MTASWALIGHWFYMPNPFAPRSQNVCLVWAWSSKFFVITQLEWIWWQPDRMQEWNEQKLGWGCVTVFPPHPFHTMALCKPLPFFRLQLSSFYSVCQKHFQRIVALETWFQPPAIYQQACFSNPLPELQLHSLALLSNFLPLLGPKKGIFPPLEMNWLN